MTVSGRSIADILDQRHRDSAHERIAVLVVFSESDFLCAGIVEKEVARPTQ